MSEIKTIPTVSDRALEMVMRDVLDGMLELSCESALGDQNIDFQIIRVDAHRRPAPLHQTPLQQHTADVIDFPQLRRRSA